jgi:RNA polymerase sigma-70 factor (family 1)
MVNPYILVPDLSYFPTSNVIFFLNFSTFRYNMDATADYSVLDDRSLLRLDDEVAFKALYDRYAPTLYHYAYRLLPVPHKAEDLLQEVFTILYLKRSELSDVQYLKAWLVQVLRNRILHEVRDTLSHSRHDREATSGQPIAALPEEQYDLHLLEIRFHEALQLLTDRCREVFLLSRVEQLSNREIADRLGVSTQAVEKHIHRALDVMHRELGDLSLPVLLLLALESSHYIK